MYDDGETLERLFYGQLHHVADLTTRLSDLGFVSDDSSDDIQAACDVLGVLNRMRGEAFGSALDEYFKTDLDQPLPHDLSLYSDHVAVEYYGTGGLCAGILEILRRVYGD